MWSKDKRMYDKIAVGVAHVWHVWSYVKLICDKIVVRRKSFIQRVSHAYMGGVVDVHCTFYSVLRTYYITHYNNGAPSLYRYSLVYSINVLRGLVATLGTRKQDSHRRLWFESRSR